MADADQTRKLAAVGPSPEQLDQELTGPDQIKLSWTSSLPGDYNMDALVNGMDVFPLAANFSEAVAGNPGNECVDGNTDGTLNGLDLFLISVNFGQRVDGINVYLDDTPGGDFNGEPLNAEPIPYTGCRDRQEFVWTIPDSTPTYFAIRSFDALTEELSELSPVVCPDAPPAIPTGLYGYPGSGSVILKWDAVSEIDLAYYELTRSKAVSGPFKVIDDDPILTPMYTDKEPGSGDRRYYKLRAVDLYGSASDWSDYVVLEAGLTPIVEGLTWRGGEDASYFDLGWLPSESPLFESWEIEYREYGGDWEPLLSGITDNIGDSKYGMISVSIPAEEGVLKDYRVAALAKDGTLSFWASVEQAGSTTPPVPPTGLTVTNYSTFSRVHFEPSASEDRYGYNVFRSETQGGPYKRTISNKPDIFERIPPMVTNSGDDTLTAGIVAVGQDRIWYVVVTTVDNMRAESDYSEEVMIRASAAPTTPTDFTVRPPLYASSAILDWTGDESDDWMGYEVWRSEVSNGLYTLVADTTENHFIDEDVEWGDSFYYTVSSYDYSEIRSPRTDPVHYNPTADPWEFHTVDTAVTEHSGISFDGSDNPVVAYMDDANEWLKVAWWNGFAWVRTTVDDTCVVDGHPRIARDSSGNVGISYHEAGVTPRLKYAWHDGDDWSIETVTDNGDPGYHSSLAYDGAGNPSIAFYDADLQTLNIATRSGASWDIVSLGDADNEGLQLCFDEQDYPCIGYLNGYMYTSEWDGETWVTDLPSEHVLPENLDFVLCQSDNYLLTYFNPDQQTYEALWQRDGEWDLSTVDSTSPAGHYGAVTFDADGLPITSYRGEEPNGDWSFAWWDGQDWRRLSHADEAILWTDLAVSPGGRPASSYVTEVSGELRVAWSREP